MRLPIIATKTHLGKALEVDCNREIITLLGPAGEQLASLTWESLIDQLLSRAKTPSPPHQQETRAQARVSLSFQVRYRTPDGTSREGQGGGIGGGGLFIESTVPLPVGTKLFLEFALPTSPSEWLEAKGVVAWVCPKSDQYTFSAGMGIRFTDIAPDVRTRVVDLVRTHRRGT